MPIVSKRGRPPKNFWAKEQKNVRKHLHEEEAKLERYPVGSKRYDKALDKIFLLQEIQRRHGG